MKIITAAQIDQLLDMPALVSALDAGFQAGITVPPRHHHTLSNSAADATLLLMPAWSSGGGAASAQAYIGTKIVTVFPGNSARSLPSVMGSYLLMDGTSGLPLAVMDGARLTLWRTAAASALAASKLARRGTARMLMVGAGELAPFMIRAHAAMRELTGIAIWNHRPERAAELAALLAREGLPARPVTDIEKACGAADLITCATLSREPLVRGEWVKPGTHVDLVGAFTPSMREVDDALLQRAEIYIDTSAALDEGGDVAAAITSGTILPSQVRGDLSGLCRGAVPGRSTDHAVTLFKSIGTALEDLVAAQLVWQRLSDPAHVTSG
jgi:ornithine cyclodeaminase/alanine dehydrogenase-like protein (mu-crystallin family)